MTALIQDLIALAAFGSALVFGIAGVLGLYRFPDAYARLQASSLCGTTAVFSVFVGALALAPSWAIASRLLVIIFFFLVSGPTSSHIVARFAWNSGLDPWKPMNKSRPSWRLRRRKTEDGQ